MAHAEVVNNIQEDKDLESKINYVINNLLTKMLYSIHKQ
jgi:hypothetical protein